MNDYAKRIISITLAFVRACTFVYVLYCETILIIYLFLIRYAETLNCPLVTILEGTLRTPETKRIYSTGAMTLLPIGLFYFGRILVQHHKAPITNSIRHILFCTVLGSSVTAIADWSVRTLQQDLTTRVMKRYSRCALDARPLSSHLGSSNTVTRTPCPTTHFISKASSTDKRTTSDTLEREAQRLYEENRYDDGVEVARKAMQLAETTCGADGFALTSILNTLARLNLGQGRATDAEKHFIRALAICETPMRKPQQAHSVPALYDRSMAVHPERMATRQVIVDNLVSLYVAQRRIPQAEQLIQSSLQIDESAFGRNDYEVTRYLRRLAELHRSQNKLSEAEPLLLRILVISDDCPYANQESLRGDLDALVDIYRAQGKDALIEPLRRRSLAIKRSSGS